MSLSKDLCLTKVSQNRQSLSGEESKKCEPKKRISFSQRFYRIMASKKINALNDKTGEMLGLSNVSQNRQSFSDRICDDLCEDILQYLLFEDKLRLECVSKQFQRNALLFLKKHNELTIETDYWSRQLNMPSNEYLYVKNKYIDLKSLEVLLKKCPNITSIKLSKEKEIFLFNPVVQLITKYCDNLLEIDFGGNRINDEIFEEFHQKFGPQINFISGLRNVDNYFFFHNIKEFELILEEGKEYMIEICVDTFPNMITFKVIMNINNLPIDYTVFGAVTHLTLRYEENWIEETVGNILTGIDTNLPNLQYLEVINDMDVTPEEVTQMANILSGLLRLQTLKLRFKSGVDFNPIKDKINEKCREIKTLEIGSN